MKLLIITWMFILFQPALARSQNSTGIIRGKVQDSLTLVAVPSATAGLYRNARMTQGTTTDSLGRFELNIPDSGSYYVLLTHMGYHPLQAGPFTVNSRNPVTDLPRLKMTPRTAALKEIKIVGEKPFLEQRADGILFNVEHLSAAGDNAIDLLRKVPLLSVDRNGGLSIRGSSNIKVFIDGKPSDIYTSSVSDALKTINGKNIRKVEVITVPSAKYDAEGADGVVNIITRKDHADAINGNIDISVGNRIGNFSADLSSRLGKWVISGDGFYQKYRNRNGSVLERTSDGLKQLQQNESRQQGNTLSGGFNVLYHIDSLHMLNMGYRMNRPRSSTSNISENYDSGNEALIPSFQRSILTPEESSERTFNVGYTGTSTKGDKEFSVLGQYFLNKGTGGYDMEQIQDKAVNAKEISRSRRADHDLTIQTDYTRSFSDRLKWEAGAKFMKKEVKSSSRFGTYDFPAKQYADDSARFTFFRYRQNIFALYNNINLKLKKWSFVAGVRYEQTSLNAAFGDTALPLPSYHNLIPQILVSKALDDRTNLKASYGIKLSRPYISNLDPTIDRSDSLTLHTGNPRLGPEMIRRYQLSYSRTDLKRFTEISLFFNDNRNSIENIRKPLDGGRFESTWENIGRDQRLGISATANWKPSDKFNISATFTGQYVWLKSAEAANSGLMRELVVNGSYKLPKGFGIDFYGFFDARNLTLQGYRSGWKFYALTISKKSGNEKWALSLKMETFLTPYSYIHEEITAPSFRQEQVFRYQNQFLRLSFSLKLGGKGGQPPVTDDQNSN